MPNETGLIWLASTAALIVVAWVMARFANVSKPGIVMWCLAMTATVALSHLPSDLFGFTLLTLLLGLASVFIMVVVSCVAFLLAAADDRAVRARNCACCVGVVVSVVVLIAAVSAANGCHHRQEAIAQTTHTLITVHELGNDVEAIKARLGRLPKDEKELVRLRGKPMPTYRAKYTIRYARRDDDSYYLTYSAIDFWGRNGDLWGWIVEYYGPNSVRRLNVISS